MLTAEQKAAILEDYNLAVQELNMTIVDIQWLLAKGSAWAIGEKSLVPEKDVILGSNDRDYLEKLKERWGVR